MKNVIGMVNFHSSPEIPPLTDQRALGSTSFLGRYAFCDFALSNLCNSEISTVGLLVKEHQRSILKHLGSLDFWLTNTKIGKTVVMYNEEAHFSPETNTDLNNIRVNDWLIYDSPASIIVIVPAHLVISLDLRPYIKEHIEKQRKVTFIAKPIDNPSEGYLGSYLFETDEEGNVVSAKRNDGSSHAPALASLGIFIVNRSVLFDAVHDPAAIRARMDVESKLLEVGLIEKRGYVVSRYEGFARYIDSFQHYMDYSLSFLQKKDADEIFKKNWPIYTLTHDSIPAVYGEEARVQNSYVANGAIIEGTVINSIISRKVTIAKGAVVRDSIIFSSAHIEKGAKVSNALIDKHAVISAGHTIKGSKNAPIYLKQGDRL